MATATWWAEKFIRPVSVPRARSVGGLTARPTVSPAAVVRPRAVRAPVVIGPLQVLVVTASIARTRAVNVPTVLAVIVPASTPGMRSVSTPSLTVGRVSVKPPPVARARAVNVPTVKPGKVPTVPTSVVRTRSVGAPTVLPAPTYVTVGAGNNSTVPPPAFNVTAPVGADIFVVVTVDRSTGNNTGAQCGTTTNNTPLVTVSHGGSATNGTTKVYRFAGIGDGTAKAISALGSGSAWWVVQAIVVANVHNVGSPQVVTGTGTAIAQTLPAGFGIQVVSTGSGGGSGGALSAFTGVTNRSNINASGTVQAINTSTAAANMTATSANTTPWLAAFIPLS